jgi:hypothetical protein
MSLPGTPTTSDERADASEEPEHINQVREMSAKNDWNNGPSKQVAAGLHVTEKPPAQIHANKKGESLD